MVPVKDLPKPRSAMRACTASSTCGRSALSVASDSLHATCAAKNWSMTSKFVFIMFKSFVLGLYASGHSLHVRVTQTFAVNRFRTGAIYSMHSKTTHRTSVFGNPMQKYCFFVSPIGYYAPTMLCFSVFFLIFLHFFLLSRV